MKQLNTNLFLLKEAKTTARSIRARLTMVVKFTEVEHSMR